MSEDFDFRLWSHRASDWSADYLDEIEQRAVYPNVEPGSIANQIDKKAPEEAEAMEDIFNDFKKIIPDGMTHWQHPRFFAYFQSNAAPAAQVAEQLATAFASQCMLWQTAPAATELEIKMVDWLRQAFGLPNVFKGSFQDTASSATLCAVLTMREQALDFKGNKQGMAGQKQLRIYASSRSHSSVDKAMWIAGIGQDNLVKIPTDEGPLYSMDAQALRAAIAEDRAAGLTPAGIIICVGATSIGACDNVAEICAIAQEEGLYSHVDAAWAGSAMICPEFRHLWQGIEEADSIVINPHKWLGVPMECSLHLVKEPALLIRTLAIQPEYLKTYDSLVQSCDTIDDEVKNIINFSEWSVQLGRRFRGLKIWFLLRNYGLKGLRSRIRNHVSWSKELAESLKLDPDFEIVTEPILSLFSFRHVPAGVKDLDQHTLNLVEAINKDGRIYLTQTDHDGIKVIRFVAGQFDMCEEDMHIACQTIIEIAHSLVPSSS